MTQVEIFLQAGQDAVNGWLSKRKDTITVHDIKINSYTFSDGYSYCDIMIVYSPKQ